MIIEKINGDRIDLSDTPIKLLSLVKTSPSPRIVTESIESMDGDIGIQTTFGQRKLRGSFFLQSVDLIDYYLQINEVFRLFLTKEPFYLIHKREPGKRWKVQTESEFTPNRIGVDGSFEVDFVSLYPYAESVGTTLDSLTFDADKWQVGQGLLFDDIKYRHATNEFRIFNAGDIDIDPRINPLKITLQGVCSNPVIKNLTTGDEWSLSGSTVANDTIILDGIRSLKNNVSCFRNTNRKLITIAPGWNDFKITGATDFTISFDFRFYYL